MKTSIKGSFIVFEGLDGSGQSTQASLLANHLEKEGYAVLVTKEPTNNLIGGIIRGVLTGEWEASPYALQLLFAADRDHHLQRTILPALAKGYVVIVDRYFYTSLAYGSLNVGVEQLAAINRVFPEPDVAFYLDVAPRVAMQRLLNHRYELELFEKEQELKRVHEAYWQVVEKHPVICPINGEREIQAIHAEIYRYCLDHLHLPPKRLPRPHS